METVSSPEEPLFSICRKSADSPEENAEVRRKQRFPTSFLPKHESSRPLDPCLRRGDGGQGSHRNPAGLSAHEGTAFFNVFPNCASRNPVGLWTPACAGVTEAGVTTNLSHEDPLCGAHLVRLPEAPVKAGKE